ncbi:E3 ubiquitin-protein ligase MARCH3 [Habropoda laboriosa]|uniref:E3 ubiquitin-protein ligase MARCH3 n=1 Tax=Habropoda laboriosa TaxID=597456 RepID=A0A0L7R4P8_9HYME|nr:PREDICTED: E3 ubiquitin-protein ligase MARCH3-like [Habropoda laboriosa]KOC65842.1 E3 ubiquitin-protein ligase MARCH3 [Habropoda laboriosa]
MEFQQSSAMTAVSGDAVTTDTPKISSSPLYRRNMTPDKRSSGSILCRICHEDEGKEELIDPCECSGTLGLIHTSCLEKWLSTSNTDRCEICKYSFVIQRKNKPLSQSFRQWWKTRSVYGPQGITGDVICLIVLTPLCIAATYLCGIGAFAYIRFRFWESTGLAVLCCMLIITYCLWLIVTIRFHFKSWQRWRRRNQNVKLMVKHKSGRILSRELQIKSFWDVGQDSNNNNSVHSNRFTAWFLTSFNNSDDHYSQPWQQQTTIV